ncbi:MAG: hypothetical protein M0Q42_00170 [Xanthomonadales bacterium]|nr:hypothetical protein [Xanthomonadales bacterium]
MNALTRLICLLALAAVSATMAHGQVPGQALDQGLGQNSLPTIGPALDHSPEQPARLRLAMAPDGRVYLSVEPATLTPALGNLALQQPARLPLQPDTQTPQYVLDLSVAAGRPAEQDCVFIGTSMHLGSLSGCDLAIAGYDGLPGAVQSLELALSLQDSGQRFGFDARYGLGWLDAARGENLPGAWLIAGDLTQAPGHRLILPGLTGYGESLALVGQDRLNLSAFLQLDSGVRLYLGYEHTDTLSQMFQPAAPVWQLGEQDSLSLGLGLGRFQGTLTGRQLRPVNPMQDQQGAINSLDLGISWRMPWRAELEFGARNLIVTPAQPEAADRDRQQRDLRVPYLRYHQEL